MVISYRMPVWVLMFVLFSCASPEVKPMWTDEFRDHLKDLGHRNWILVVDKAFPALNTDGIDMLTANVDLPRALEQVLQHIAASSHVKPVLYSDEEFGFVSKKQVPNILDFRAALDSLVKDYPVRKLKHDSLFAFILEKSRMFKVLVVKTEGLVPYSSVFIELDCKYWSVEAEKDLRTQMNKSIKE